MGAPPNDDVQGRYSKPDVETRAAVESVAHTATISDNRQPHGRLEVDVGSQDIEKGLSDQNTTTQTTIVDQGADVDKPYSSFSKKQKMMIVACATFGGLFSPFTTNIYFPALDTIASALNVSISQVNITITTYMIFQAVAPTFISTFTDTQGRRPTYVVGFIIYIAANIGLALNNTYAGLLALRCLQSCGSSGMITIQQAIIADVITSAERGSYMGITSMTSIIAPSVAPIVGGVLSSHLGWHSIFWFLLILAAIYLIPLLLFMPETARKLVGDGSELPPKWNMSLFNMWNAYHRRKQGTQTDAHPSQHPKRKRLRWPDPRSTLSVFLDKETSLILFTMSITYAAFYGISASLTVQFSQIYGLNSTEQGLLFIPQAVGSLMAGITNGFLLDKNYRRYCRKAGIDGNNKTKQIDLRGFPIEKVRLEITLPMFIMNSLFTIVYGWMLQYEVHIAGPIVILVFIGYTLMAGFNGLSVLQIDVNRHRAASASAASNLSRCLMGAGMTAVIEPMILRMGRGWCFTFTALIQLCCLPSFWFCMHRGVQWRAEKAQREEAKKMIEMDKIEKEQQKNTNHSTFRESSHAPMGQ